MNAKAAVNLDEDVQIPAEVFSFTRFRKWSQSDRFPERGRIDFLNGLVEVDLSPEKLYTHGVVKTAIAAEFFTQISKTGRGSVFVDRTRVVSVAAGLSAEPDVVVVLWQSLRDGRVREVPAASGDFIELEGAPDLIVEIVSDRSVRKDRETLPVAYAAAGVPELWTVDARGPVLEFEIAILGTSGYRRQPADADGWAQSPLLDRACRLVRRPSELGRWVYELEIVADS
ncbi:MAG TPA: Uma2 family endonuclease [Thermoanaerobaculia bacterium]|jgi:Uma2 family endonuclease|nr:Uma2 family endonuclease [Thermoanaerobaculia bacterium]